MTDVDFDPLRRRLLRAVAVLAVPTLVAVVVDGARGGLSGALLLRWAAALGAVWTVVAMVLVALHALRVANDAQRRGERLSGDDVGLAPRRRP